MFTEAFPCSGADVSDTSSRAGAALVFLQEVSVTSAVPTRDLCRPWHSTKASREVFTLMPFPCALMFLLLMALI